MKRMFFLYLLCLLCVPSLANAQDATSSQSATKPPISATTPTTSGKTSPYPALNSTAVTPYQGTSGQLLPGNPITALPAGVAGQLTPGPGTEMHPLVGKTRDELLEKAKADEGKVAEPIGPLPVKPVAPPEMSLTEKKLNSEAVLLDTIQPLEMVPNTLTQFGYSFFRPEVLPLTPTMDIPVGPDYVLGVGDRINLTLWGSLDGTYELEVNRSGEVVLPRVGTVKLAGVRYGELQQVIRASLAKVFKDFQLNVNMGKLRLINVYLVGEVTTPGEYTLSSLATLLNALAAAGGPTKSGSLRSIQIKRGGGVAETVDLYDFFLKGDKGRDIRLHAGDTIFVPTIGPVAGIAGAVRRPAIYELKGEKSLKDLLVLADGINPGAYLQRIQLSRVDAHSKKVVTDFNLDPGSAGKSVDELTSAIALQDLDMVNVFSIDSTLRNYVKLEGYVLRPGNYAIHAGMHVSRLLAGDNLLPEYYRESGQITRRSPPDLHPEVFFFNVGKALTGDPAHDLLLQEFDKVQIFSRWEMEDIPKVRINGEVQKPGEYRLFQNMTVRDLLLQAGNLKLTAYLKNAELTRVNKAGDSVTSFSTNINMAEAMQGNPRDNMVLQPFDELNIRKIPNWAEETERYITLKGEFVFPGLYPIYKGEQLSSVIRRAGGFTDKAYLPGAKFTREQIRVMQQKRMDEITTRTEIDLTKKQSELASTAASKEELEATKAALEGMLRTLAILKNAKAEGRMVIRLAPEEALRKSEYNFEVVGGDVLEVPNDPKVVSVMGQVYNPTSFLHLAANNVKDYLAKAGGATRDAEKDDIYVIKADGAVVSRQMSSGGFLGFGGFMSSRPDSGDTIVVPQRLERIAWMREIKDISFIFGQLALTAGVLIAAGL